MMLHANIVDTGGYYNDSFGFFCPISSLFASNVMFIVCSILLASDSARASNSDKNPQSVVNKNLVFKIKIG